MASSSSELASELDPLFRLAQSLTDNSAEAKQLTQRTIREASRRLNEGEQPAERSLWLRHIMVDVYRSPSDMQASTTDDADLRDDYRQKALRQFLRSAMPGAYAALSSDERSILLLCKVDNLSCADAAHVLNTHADAASALLSDAFASLRGHIYEMASGPERELLRAHLSDELFKRALLHFVSTSLRQPPASLREEIASELERPAAPKETTDASEKAPTSTLISSTWVRRASLAMSIILLIAIAGVVGYVATYQLGSPDETNLLTLSANEARSVQMDQMVTNDEQASVIIRDELGMRVSPPQITQTDLRGVDITEIADGVRVPVLIYRDGESTIPIYVYTYAQLNRYEDRINLSSTVMRSLENERQVVTQEASDGQIALLWRDRDKIFVAIPPTEVGDLRDRIIP